MRKFRFRFLNSLFILLFFVFIALIVIIGNLFESFVFKGSSENTLQTMWSTLVVTFLIGFLFTVYMSSRVSTQLTRPLEGALKVANELANGNFKARTYEYQMDETGQLSHALNILARNLQNMTSSYEMQQNRLMTLIENMDSGLILIDAKGYINLVNKHFKETFEVEADQWLNKVYHEAIPFTELSSIIEETFMIEKTVRKQISLPIGIEIKHFDVSGAPILVNGDKLTGVVFVFHDISEIKKLEQMRKDFVANVSHELKTPVTSLKGFAETLLDGAMENKAFREHFLKIILEESDRLQSLIQDLLDLSKLEQAHFSLDWQKVDVCQLAENSILIMKKRADEKNITIDFSSDENAVISADANRLKQVFLNLISNSINYTPPGGKIRITVTKQGETVKFKIADTGIGIDKEELPRIFERFYRVDKARSRNSGGTGLGLAIVKHIIEAHHASIKVESEPGEGTSFIITFLKERK
ncbi:two-component system histidine kinase PnpS [Pseudalkalibacillus caeni]|uniref:histidine kinase n=1 Tax=Exobacillus caeni TaxID=2574798 RepID=A0A5R9FAB8_9BACL|nr:HAMP domain-containing sensor histidine kinase [Pseudalkalibacillus caeni]TLS39146.1 PAS domain-containing protein [Pseudalkalibacillus caeni]